MAIRARRRARAGCGQPAGGGAGGGEKRSALRATFNRAKQIAAATVNKKRAIEVRTKPKSKK